MSSALERGSPNRPGHRLVLRGEVDGQRLSFTLRPGRNRIGALPSHEICLSGNGISKHHAMVRLDSRNIAIEDLTSKNGTFVNGRRIRSGNLCCGDRLGLGTVSLVLDEVAAEDVELAVELTAPGAQREHFSGETSSYLALSRWPTSRRLLALFEGLADDLINLPNNHPPGDFGPLLRRLATEVEVDGLQLLNCQQPGKPVLLAHCGALAQPDTAQQATVQLDGPVAQPTAVIESTGLALRVFTPTPLIENHRALLRSALKLIGLRQPEPLSTHGTLPAPEHRRPKLSFPTDHLPGRSAPMVELYRQMQPAARSPLPVLICGETGTGKEGIAHTLHLSGDRADGPFVAINCAALPAELIEAELFGIGRGVATGVTSRQGKFRQAQGGTLQLDEIGDLPLAQQAKLLRALQEREIAPLGEAPVALDVRVIATTNSSLEQLMEAGDFRRDLYYRLAGLVLQVPPLRARPQDIPSLVAHFLHRSVDFSGREIRGVTLAAMTELCGRPWPGNVRQLEHAIHRLAHLCPTHQAIDSELLADCETAALPLPEPAVEPAPTQAAAGRRSFDAAALSCLRLDQIERQLLSEALHRTSGNLTRAGDLLGLTRQALKRRLTRHGLAVNPKV